MTLINAGSIPFTDMHYRPDDEISEAVKCWRSGDIELFDFACLANSIVGKRDGGTEILARKIRREVDTVERYAAAGALWEAMLRYYPSDSELWRESLEVSFWMAVGAKFKADIKDIVKAHLAENKPIDSLQVDKADELAQAAKSAKYYMDEAYKSKMTVEKFRDILPTTRITITPFVRAARRITNIIEKDILKAPALNSGMNDREYKAFIKTAEWLVRLLKGTVLK